jgi:hypothetical protein
MLKSLFLAFKWTLSGDFFFLLLLVILLPLKNSILKHGKNVKKNMKRAAQQAADYEGFQRHKPEKCLEF